MIRVRSPIFRKTLENETSSTRFAVVCSSLPVIGATFLVPYAISEVPKSTTDCDTLILMSGIKIVGEILEEDETTYRFAYCDQERVVLLYKSDIKEIRYTSGEVINARVQWLSQNKKESKRSDLKKRKRLIRVGLILIGLGLVSALPLGYLVLGLGFGGLNTLGGIVAFIPFGVFLIGAVKLIKGLLARRSKG